MAQGPQNAIVGEDYGVEIPVMQAPAEDLAQEKNMAKFSKTKEYQLLKEYLEARIAFFQGYLPNGSEVRFEDPSEAATNWIVATNVIAEFKNVLSTYERANEVVKEASK